MMRRITYLFLLIVVPLLSAANDKADALFKMANQQFTAGKYQDAIKSYQSILTGGYQSATVYFNIGNAYYKLGDIASALLYYEKAHKLAPADDDINFNIQLASLKTTDKVEPVPQLFLIKWWHSVVLGFAASTWAVFAVAFFTVGFGLLVWYLFAQSVALKKAFFFIGLSVVTLGLVTILLASYQAGYLQSHQQAIVFSNSVTIKSEPVNTSKNLFVIHEGTKVDVLENTNGWTRVRLANGSEGWMPANGVKNI